MESNNEIDKFVYDTFKNNELHKINNLYLSNRQIDVLDKYNIDYKKMIDVKTLIFEIEEYINDNYMYEDLSDLENLSQELAEFNYYYNTNK